MSQLDRKQRPASHAQEMWLQKYATEQPMLLPYQTKWILDDSPLKACEKGRQIGMTWSEALWSVRRRATLKIDHYFSSADWLTSKNFIKDCKTWAEVFNVALEHNFIKIEDSTAETLTFPNGARVVAVSSSPRAMRGKRGDVTLDEYAFHENAEDLLTAAQACTTWGGCLHLISTHNGPATPFYNIVEGAKKGQNDYSLHRIDLNEAVKQGLALKVPGKHLDWLPNEGKVGAAFIRSCRQKCLSEESFQQEYLCNPWSAGTLILPAEYDACLEACKGWTKIPDSFDAGAKYNELFVGVDVGRAKAMTVIWVLERGFDPNPETPDSLRNVYRSACVIPIFNHDIATQYVTLKPILSHPAMSGCAIDMGAIGRALSDMAVHDFGDLAEPVAMTAPMKARCAEYVKHFIQTCRVAMPEDPMIREDIIALRRLVSQKKTIAYDGQSALGHCDSFWALGLALYAAEKSSPLSIAVYEAEHKQINAATLQSRLDREEKKKPEAPAAA